MMTRRDRGGRGPSRSRMDAAAGISVPEVMVGLALMGIVAAVAVPAVAAGVDRSRGLAAARYLASRMALARLQALSRSATVALVFDQINGHHGFRVVVDGNGNGVRTADIQAGTDREVESRVQLEDLFPGAAIGVAPGLPMTDAVQLGATNLLSFTAAGTSSTGTVHVRGRDGTQWGVRVLGATGRARVLRYDPASRQWVEPR